MASSILQKNVIARSYTRLDNVKTAACSSSLGVLYFTLALTCPKPQVHDPQNKEASKPGVTRSNLYSSELKVILQSGFHADSFHFCFCYPIYTRFLTFLMYISDPLPSSLSFLSFLKNKLHHTGKTALWHGSLLATP